MRQRLVLNKTPNKRRTPIDHQRRPAGGGLRLHRMEDQILNHNLNHTKRLVQTKVGGSKKGPLKTG